MMPHTPKIATMAMMAAMAQMPHFTWALPVGAELITPLATQKQIKMTMWGCDKTTEGPVDANLALPDIQFRLAGELSKSIR
jgi:hypothetical protein